MKNQYIKELILLRWCSVARFYEHDYEPLDFMRRVEFLE